MYIRAKKEEWTVSKKGVKITSPLEKDFSLDIPSGTYEKDTAVSMMVKTLIETNVCHSYKI